MASVVTLGLSKIEVGTIAADGGMGTTLAQLGYTYKDTAQMQQEDGTTTDFTVEELDTPIESITEAGKLTFNFSIADADLTTFAALFGGTATSTSWSMPDTVPDVEMSVKITPKKGLIFSIPRAKVTAKLNGSFSKTNLFLVEVSCVVLQPKKAATSRVTFTISLV
jgi:hypothetical protein